MHMKTTMTLFPMSHKVGGQAQSPDTLKSHTNSFKEFQKLWHNYTMAFCFMALRNNKKMEKYSLVQALWHHSLQVHLYTALSTRDVTPNYNTRLPVTVQIPTGVIKSFYHDIYYPVHSLITEFSWAGNFEAQTLLWIFTLHPKLALNFTIHDLHISLRSPVDCDFGKLIISKFNCDVNNRTLCQQLDNSNTFAHEEEEQIQNCTENHFRSFQNSKISWRLLYCGHLANFSIFPISSEIVVEVQNKQCRYYEMSSSFMVMDINTVISLPNQNVKKQLRIVDNLLFVRQTIKLVTYFLQTNKSCRIILNSSWEQTKSIIFDGPDELAKIILKNNGIYLTSTFQCLVQILSDKKYCQQINFVSAKLSESFALRLRQQQEPTFLHLPTRQCREVCSALLLAPPGFYINVSVSSLYYQGKHSLHCKYGGTFTVELISGQYIENPTLCKHLSLNSSRVRNQHSHRNEFTVIQYFYSGLSKVHTILKISLSSCSLTQIDVCQLYKSCFTSSPACISLLNKITEWSGLKLLFEEAYSFYPILHRSSQANTRCYLLQLTAGSGSGIFLKHSCEINLLAPAKVNPNNHITHSLTGVLQPSIMKSSFTQKSNCKMKSEFVEVSGKVDKFVCFVQNKNCLFSNQMPYPANIEQLMHLGLGVSEVHFFMHIDTKKPRSINILQTKVMFSMYSPSWLDILIKTHESGSNSMRFPIISSMSQVVDLRQHLDLIQPFLGLFLSHLSKASAYLFFLMVGCVTVSQ